MPDSLKSVLLGVDGRTIGPFVVNAQTADLLLAWHDHGKPRAFLLLGQLPTEMRDDTVRTVALQLAKGHVGYIQVEAVRNV
jgi:hypothetical protein